MAKDWARPVRAVAADQRRKPAARTQQTLKRSAIQPAMERNWKAAQEKKKPERRRARIRHCCVEAEVGATTGEVTEDTL